MEFPLERRDFPHLRLIHMESKPQLGQAWAGAQLPLLFGVLDFPTLSQSITHTLSAALAPQRGLSQLNQTLCTQNQILGAELSSASSLNAQLPP